MTDIIYEEELDKNSLDQCECNHIRLQHIEDERCIWCSCSFFKRQIDSKNKYENK